MLGHNISTRLAEHKGCEFYRINLSLNLCLQLKIEDCLRQAVRLAQTKFSESAYKQNLWYYPIIYLVTFGSLSSKSMFLTDVLGSNLVLQNDHQQHNIIFFIKIIISARMFFSLLGASDSMAES